MPIEGRGPIPLDAVRNLLLPTIKHMQAMHQGKVMSIAIDNENDCLLVRLQDEKTKRKIGFSIKRHEITARSYINSFQPNIVGLLNALSLPQEVFDKMYPAENTLEASVEPSRSAPDVGASPDHIDTTGAGDDPTDLGWDRVGH